jgi:hypothetical protein
MVKNVHENEGYCTQYTNLHLLQELYLIVAFFSELLQLNIVLFLSSSFLVPGELESAPRHTDSRSKQTPVYTVIQHRSNLRTSSSLNTVN